MVDAKSGAITRLVLRYPPRVRPAMQFVTQEMALQQAQEFLRAYSVVLPTSARLADVRGPLDMGGAQWAFVWFDYAGDVQLEGMTEVDVAGDDGQVIGFHHSAPPLEVSLKPVLPVTAAVAVAQASARAAKVNVAAGALPTVQLVVEHLPVTPTQYKPSQPPSIGADGVPTVRTPSAYAKQHLAYRVEVPLVLDEDLYATRPALVVFVDAIDGSALDSYMKPGLPKR